MDWSKVKISVPIPADAVQVHLYDPENMLRPRGTLRKESLSADIQEDLKNTYEHWTDPKYGDNPPESEVVAILVRNAREEVEAAIGEFLRTKKKKTKPV